MNKFLVSLSTVAILAFAANTCYAIYGEYEDFSEEIQEIQHQAVVIPKGTFFRGLMGQTVSSEYNNTNDIVKILVTADYSLNDKIIIPKNSIFLGKIKGLHKAQQGLDGTFSIDIISLVYPDGRNYPVKGYVISKGKDKIFGGGFTKRAGHKTTLHRSEAFAPKGTLYLQQNGPRIIGKEIKITMGDVVTIAIEEEVKIED